MKCQACFKELNKKELLFAEDKQAYCVNPFTCNEHHPNSVKHIVERGAAVRMFTEDELEENLFERLDISDEMKERIQKVATKPQSIRLSKLEIAHYLLELQDKCNLSSISEAVRYCVLYTMREMPIDTIKFEDVPNEDVESPNEAYSEAHNNAGGLTGIVVPDIPKSVNVDWSKVDTKPEPEKEPEDEFTF